MPDSYLDPMKKGEALPLYATLASDVGALAITDVDFTLYDSDGVAVEESADPPTWTFDHVDVSGYTDQPASTVQAWYVLDTQHLTAGQTYTASFGFEVVGSDSLTRLEIVNVNFLLVAVDD